MHKRSIIPFLILLMFGLGCGLFMPRPRSTALVEPSPTPTPPIVKVVDVPAIYGKSVAEVKKAVTGGKITYESKDSIRYEFPQGRLSVDARVSTGKSLYYGLADNFSGRSYDFVADSPQQLANFAGIDLSANTLVSSTEGSVIYGARFNGVPVEIVFVRREPGKDKFDNLMVSMRRRP
jgi:hypothetical protein